MMKHPCKLSYTNTNGESPHELANGETLREANNDYFVFGICISNGLSGCYIWPIKNNFFLNDSEKLKNKQMKFLEKIFHPEFII